MLDGVEEAPQASDPDALEDYGIGYDLGARWAADRATADELKAVAAYAHVSWFRLHLNVEHSLPSWLTAELGHHGWAGHGWAGLDQRGLRREPLVEGLVAGAASFHDSRCSRSRPR